MSLFSICVRVSQLSSIHTCIGEFENVLNLLCNYKLWQKILSVTCIYLGIPQKLIPVYKATWSYFESIFTNGTIITSIDMFSFALHLHKCDGTGG